MLVWPHHNRSREVARVGVETAENIAFAIKQHRKRDALFLRILCIAEGDDKDLCAGGNERRLRRNERL